MPGLDMPHSTLEVNLHGMVKQITEQYADFGFLDYPLAHRRFVDMLRFYDIVVRPYTETVKQVSALEGEVIEDEAVS
jgi:hypothetical protein